ERSVAAHGEIRVRGGPGIDVAALFRNAQHPAAAAAAAEVELAGEVEVARLFRTEVVRHHAHHGVDVGDADALQLDQADHAAVTGACHVGRRAVATGWNAVPFTRARRID